MHFTEVDGQLARGRDPECRGAVHSGVAITRRQGGLRGPLRRSIGGVLLLGIEVLVSADLITRFSQEIEIDGMPRWRRAAMN
jgi:hypothetical protein